MRHIWSVICRSSSLDIRSNNLSLFNLIERISFQLQLENEDSLWEQEGNIAVPIDFEFVTLWWKDSDDDASLFDIRLTQICPDEKTFVVGETSLDMSLQSRLRNIFQIKGIHYSGDGIYRFALQIKADEMWNTVTEIPLEVVRRQENREA